MWILVRFVRFLFGSVPISSDGDAASFVLASASAVVHSCNVSEHGRDAKHITMIKMWLIGHSMNFSIGNKLVPPYAQQPSRSPLVESTDTPASIFETAQHSELCNKIWSRHSTVSHLPKPRFVDSKTVCLDSYGATSNNCTAAEDVSGLLLTQDCMSAPW